MNGWISNSPYIFALQLGDPFSFGVWPGFHYSWLAVPSFRSVLVRVAVFRLFDWVSYKGFEMDCQVVVRRRTCVEEQAQIMAMLI